MYAGDMSAGSGTGEDWEVLSSSGSTTSSNSPASLHYPGLQPDTNSAGAAAGSSLSRLLPSPRAAVASGSAAGSSAIMANMSAQQTAVSRADRPLNIVLIGAIGSGKSAAGNTILGSKVFASRHAAGAVTKHTETAGLDENDKHAVIFDTPGLEAGGQGDAAREVLQALAAASADSARVAIAFVVSAATPFGAADHAALCSLVAYLGPDALKRALLVFTHSDVLAADGTALSDYLADAPPDLQVVLQQVAGRTVLLDNRAGKSACQQQANTLLAAVEDMLSGSGDLESFTMPDWTPLAQASHVSIGATASGSTKSATMPTRSSEPERPSATVSRPVVSETHTARLATALAASERRRLELERTVREMPKLRRGIAYALTAAGMLGVRMLMSQRESMPAAKASYSTCSAPYNLYGPLVDGARWSLDAPELPMYEPTSGGLLESPRCADIETH